MFSRLRESWQDPKLPVTGPAMPPLTQYTDVAIHYTSATKIPANIDAYHRAMQADYEKSRGFSLGYTGSADMFGVSREIRGLDFRPAATRTANGYALAILVLVDGAEEASPEACAEVRRLIGWFESLAGRHLNIRPHSAYVPTGCPGDGLRAQIESGVFSPRWVDPSVPPPPVPSPVEVDRMFILVGNADNRNDPRRWVWDGAVSMRLLGSAQEYTDLVNRAAVNLIKLHPAFSSLSDPFWMSSAERSIYGG